jgi:hypothetical protein
MGAKQGTWFDGAWILLRAPARRRKRHRVVTLSKSTKVLRLHPEDLDIPHVAASLRWLLLRHK